MSSVSGISSVSPFDVSSATQKISSAKADTTTNSSTNSSGTTASTTSSDSALTSSVGTTFMDLLVKELQNQDPTAPMDSTAMVGQMISLNQLDQLMSINEDLSGTSTSTSSSTSSTGSTTGTTTSPSSDDSTGTSSAAVVAARAAMANASSTLTDPTSAANASSVLNLSGLSTSNINGVN